MTNRVNARNMYRSLINVLYVNKQEFSASIRRSNKDFTFYPQSLFIFLIILKVNSDYLSKDNRRIDQFIGEAMLFL
jgi:hypothetical protein